MLYRYVIVGLLARDCKEAILRNKLKIERLCASFEDYHIVVVENDSVDGTRQVLLDWAKEDDRVLVDSFFDHSLKLSDSGYERISHMAYLRNRLLDDIRKQPAPDLVIMMDVDIYDFDVEGLMEGINYAPNDWGALMANGRMMKPNDQYLDAQFDQYAYMACGEELSDMHFNMFTNHSLYKRGRKLNSEVQICDYVPVNSAFGGMAVYRYEAIKDLRYQAVKIDVCHQKFFCEHVPFHLDMIHQGYKNYVCRNIVVNNGIVNLRPVSAFLLYHFPHIYAVLCDINKYIHNKQT